MTFTLEDFFKTEIFLLVVSEETEGFFSVMGGGGSSIMVRGSSPQVEYPSLPDSELLCLGIACNFSFSTAL